MDASSIHFYCIVRRVLCLGIYFKPFVFLPDPLQLIVHFSPRCLRFYVFLCISLHCLDRSAGHQMLIYRLDSHIYLLLYVRRIRRILINETHFRYIINVYYD